MLAALSRAIIFCYLTQGTDSKGGFFVTNQQLLTQASTQIFVYTCCECNLRVACKGHISQVPVCSMIDVYISLAGILIKDSPFNYPCYFSFWNPSSLFGAPSVLCTGPAYTYFLSTCILSRTTLLVATEALNIVNNAFKAVSIGPRRSPLS